MRLQNPIFAIQLYSHLILKLNFHIKNWLNIVAFIFGVKKGLRRPLPIKTRKIGSRIFGFQEN